MTFRVIHDVAEEYGDQVKFDVDLKNRFKDHRKNEGGKVDKFNDVVNMPLTKIGPLIVRVFKQIWDASILGVPLQQPMSKPILYLQRRMFDSNVYLKSNGKIESDKDNL